MMGAEKMILSRLRQAGCPKHAKTALRYFKTGAGQYGYGDKFLGIRMPALRAIVSETKDKVRLDQAEILLQSPWHEVRMYALIWMTHAYKNGDDTEQKQIYQTYRKNFQQINNWDLVDCSAPLVTGAYLLKQTPEFYPC